MLFIWAFSLYCNLPPSYLLLTLTQSGFGVHTLQAPVCREMLLWVQRLWIPVLFSVGARALHSIQCKPSRQINVFVLALKHLAAFGFSGQFDDLHRSDLVQYSFQRNPVGSENPSDVFRFLVEERTQCCQSRKVRYTERVDYIMQLPVAMEAATNKGKGQNCSVWPRDVPQCAQRPPSVLDLLCPGQRNSLWKLLRYKKGTKYTNEYLLKTHTHKKIPDQNSQKLKSAFCSLAADYKI